LDFNWKESMKEKKNILEEPLCQYGKHTHIKDGIEFHSMPNMMETLRAQGCITHSELLERLSKYM